MHPGRTAMDEELSPIWPPELGPRWAEEPFSREQFRFPDEVAAHAE